LRPRSVTRVSGLFTWAERLVTQMMDESSRLLTMQEQLEKEADGKVTFFGLSVNETIRTCLLNGMSKRADKVKTDFKVPDKRSVLLLKLKWSIVLICCIIASGMLNCRH
jgi:hypothetical protein